MASWKSINGQNKKKCSQVLNTDNINQHLKDVKLGSFFPLMRRAREIHEEIQSGVAKPFTEVMKGFLGDHQAMGQVPITFIREVMAVVTYPALLHEARFADDVKTRAKDILASCSGETIGSYSRDAGNEVIRQHVAEFIAKRDGAAACDWNDITLSNGVTAAIESVLKLLMADVDGKKSGVMVPIPQYPIYSTLLAKLNMPQIDYYLDEENDWGLKVSELSRAVNEARAHCNPRAIVIINPGNPTGQVLSRANIQEIIRFAYSEDLVILADEVYQDNVYAQGCQFHSFKKVLTEMGPPYGSMELASFMSISKGYMGECGLRGGYVELLNLDPEVRALSVNAFPSMTCPSTFGQAVLDCVVKPPQPGDQSYHKFMAEKTEILDSLAERAKMVTEAFNSMEGMSCNTVQGAMYAFPQIKFSAKAMAAAEQAGLAVDAFFAFALLENTGICILPGSCFRQKPGTFHIRTTILPQPDKLKLMLEGFRTFYMRFLELYK